MPQMNKTSWLMAGLLSGAILWGNFARAQTLEEDFSHLFDLGDTEPVTWTRHFRVGAMVGFNFKAQFATSGTFRFSQNNPGAAGVANQDHIYDDGYVKVGAYNDSTGDTWNWGYQNTNQIVGNQLLFHAADTYTANGDSTAESDATVGFELAYGGKLKQWGNASVGWELGFGFMPIKIEDNRTISGVSATRITHAYNITGITMPDAPYTGSYNGPGALIDGTVQTETTSTVNNLNLTGTRELDVNMYSLRLGPTLEWELHPRVGVAVSAGAAFGVLSGDLNIHESVLFTDGSTAVNIGSSSSTELIYGGYVSAMVLLHTVQNGDLYLGVQYMPMSDATFNGAGREAKLDMSGAFYFSLGINWPF